MAEVLVEKPDDFEFLSELYFEDVPEAVFLAEYPSSNSRETVFQNASRYIIHDPFPPPRAELLKILGPHHLMCAWGQRIPVTSQVMPPESLLDHWENAMGLSSRPHWQPFDVTDQTTPLITIFPHESLPADQQVVDPQVNYELHAKQVIEKIDCPQADVLSEIQPPCIVKLSHGYAGLGNFFIRNKNDENAMRRQLAERWPTAECVINSVITDVQGDFGVQFYLRKNGTVVWLGFTEQQFDDAGRWMGGNFSASMQDQLFDAFSAIIVPVGAYLHSRDYFGLVGIDLLQNSSGELFLVDVNPRLTGVSPFLMAARMFLKNEGLSQGIYRASCHFSGSLDKLIEAAESSKTAKVLVLSAFSESDGSSTIAHLSANAGSEQACHQALADLVGG